MKYCVSAQIKFSSKTSRDNVSKTVKDKIASKMLWGGKEIRDYLSDDGKAITNVELRFDKKEDRDELATYLKDRINKIPALSGTVKIHNCYHDENPPKPCIEEEI